LFVALMNALEERRYDLAIMRLLGASRARIAALLLIEAWLLAAVALAAGFELALLALYVVGAWLADPVDRDTGTCARGRLGAGNSNIRRADAGMAREPDGRARRARAGMNAAARRSRRWARGAMAAFGAAPAHVGSPAAPRVRVAAARCGASRYSPA
jgi:ABC-type antimicrobial peptide transport system permease subunit